MSNKITATFVQIRIEDSGSDQAPDYYVYDFTDIVDDRGKRHKDKWIKQTKLMKAVSFKKGHRYKITLSKKIDSNINLPFPIEIAWDKEKVYMKGGNSIIEVDKDNKEKNLSIPINKILGINNYETAAKNKFGKGLLTEELLLKINARGKFFFVHYYDPQDKRKTGGCSYGLTTKEKENFVLIQKESQSEIDRALENIKRDYVTKAIDKYFTFKTEILTIKRKKS